MGTEVLLLMQFIRAYNQHHPRINDKFNYTPQIETEEEIKIININRINQINIKTLLLLER